MNTSLNLDSYQAEDIAQLVGYGLGIVKNNQEEINEVCEGLVDQKMRKLKVAKCNVPTP